MERIAILVKYFPLSHRISGLTSFATLLAEQMSSYYELHVFSKCPKEIAEEFNKTSAYTLHSVPKPFWWRVARYVKQVNVKKVIILSGVHKSRFLYLIFKPLLMSLPTDIPLHFYQTTILDGGATMRFKSLLSRCKHIICTNTMLMPMLSDDFENRCIYLPPGSDLDRAHRATAAAKGADIRIGFFNHFNKIKGIDIALAAFSTLEFDDTEYVIAGSGTLEAQMRNQYTGNKRIKFLGYLINPIPEIKACDYLVLPFRTSVSILGVSQTLLESLAAGVPVIGANTEVITSAVSHEKQGLIFDRPEQLVDCIRRLHDDRDLRIRVAQGALEKSKDFNIKTTAKKLYDLIEENQ